MIDAKEKAYSAIRHYLELGRHERVLALAGEQLASDPEDAYLHYVSAYCLYRLERYTEAEEALEDAVRFGCDADDIHMLRGHLYTETSRWSEAEAEYLAVLRMQPDDAAAHAYYGYLMWKAGHVHKAEKLIREALLLGPEDASVLRIHHLYQLARSGKDEQLRALERFVEHAGNDVAMHAQIGLSELYRGRLSAAREHFVQAYLLDPSSKPLHNIVKSLEQERHPLLLPLEWVNRIGGPTVVWLVGFGSIIAARALGYGSIALVLSLIYLLFVVYSWTAVGIVKLLNKRGGG